MKMHIVVRRLLALGVLIFSFGAAQAQQSLGSFQQVITKGTCGSNGLGTVVLSSSPNPSSYEQTVTITATMPSVPNGTTAPTGTVQFFDNSTSLGSAPVSGSTSVITYSTFTVGTHPLTAQYSGDPNYNACTSNSDIQVVTQATTSGLSLTSAPNPSTFLQSVTFTATVPAGATGSFSFYDNSTLLASNVPITGTTATYTTSQLSVGTHPVTAQYSGDVNFLPGTTNVDNQIVQKYVPGAGFVVLTSAPNPSTYLQSVTFTATFPVLSPEPSGQVQFVEGGTVIGTGNITGNTATFTTSNLSVGTHAVTAVYGGDTSYGGATSAVDDQVVNPYNSGSGFVVLTSTPNPSTYTQAVTFTATFPVLSTEPTGTVTFTDGAIVLATGVPITGNTASYTTTTAQILTVGIHYVTATYSGDVNFQPATSNVDSQVVNQATVTSTETNLPNPAAYTQTVTMTITVIPPTNGATPTGTVTLDDGTNPLGTVPLNSSGVGTLTVDTLSVGTHTINVTYSGDANYN